MPIDSKMVIILLSHNEMQYRNKNAQTSTTPSNMDEFPSIMLSEIRHTQQSNATWFHLYKIQIWSRLNYHVQRTMVILGIVITMKGGFWNADHILCHALDAGFMSISLCEKWLNHTPIMSHFFLCMEYFKQKNNIDESVQKLTLSYTGECKLV